jgi:hypothetical protein
VLKVCAGSPALHRAPTHHEISGASGRPAHTILNLKPPRGLAAREAGIRLRESHMWRPDTRAVMVIADGKCKFIGEIKWDKSERAGTVA